MLNKVILIGNIGKDPELKTTNTSVSYCETSICCNETWKDKEGNKQSKATWIDLVFWQKGAEIASQYIKKGSLIQVEGKIVVQEWEDQEGNKRRRTKIKVDNFNMLTKKESDSPMPSGNDNPF